MKRFFFFFNFIYLILAVLGLCCSGFSVVASSRGCSLVAVCRLLIAVSPLVATHVTLRLAVFSNCDTWAQQLWF